MHQQWRKSITTLAFVLFSAVAGGALAQAPKSPLAMKPDAPDRYTVVPGDTLWSIAERTYAGDPREGVWELRERNGLDSTTITPGQVLVVPT